MKNFKKVLSLALALLMVVGCMVVAPVETKAATADHVVIHELYGGGGNSGAVYTNDYIVLYNPTSEDVSLQGWGLHYVSASAEVFNNNNVTSLTGTIPAGGYYLVKEKAGSNTVADFPTGVVVNCNSEINLSGTKGVLVLAKTTALLSGTTDANIVDLVGFGTAKLFEGTAAPAPSNSTAIVRKEVGVDSDINSADFKTITPNLSYLVGEGGGSTPAPEPTPEPTPTVGTIAEALAGATNSLWTVKGVVTLIDGKNVYIQDTTGGIDAYLASAPTDIALGDTIEVTGKRAEYKGLPELASATYTKSTGLTLEAKKTTIAALTTADICKYVKITGLTVTEFVDTKADGTPYDYPNITVTDGTDTIQIYKAVVAKDGDVWAIKVGDKIDVVAAVGVFNTTLQLRNTLASEITAASQNEDDTNKDAAWTAGSTEDLTIRFDMNFADFKELRIDGNVVDAKYYTAVEGSVIVTLKADYLNTLEAGSYTVSAVANDNSTVDANLTVAASNIDNAGDNFLPMFLIFAAGCAIVAVGVIGRRKHA